MTRSDEERARDIASYISANPGQDDEEMILDLIRQVRAEAYEAAAEAARNAPLASFEGAFRREADARGTQLNCVSAIKSLATARTGKAPSHD